MKKQWQIISQLGNVSRKALFDENRSLGGKVINKSAADGLSMTCISSSKHQDIDLV